MTGTSVAGAPRRGRWARSVGADLFGLVALVAAVLLIAGAGLTAVAYRDARNLAEADVDAAADLASAAVIDSVEQARQALAGLGPVSTSILGAPPEACQLAFSPVGVFASGHLDVLGPDGRVACSSLAERGAPPGATYAGAPFLDRVGKGEVAFLPSDPLTGKPALALGVTSPGPDGGPAATAVIVLDGVASSLARTYGGRLGLGFLLVTEDGATPLSTSFGTGEANERLATLPPLGQRPPPGLVGEQRRVYGQAAVEGLGLRLVAGAPEEAALAPARDELWRRIALVSLGVVALAALALGVRRRLLVPVRSLSAAVRRATSERGVRAPEQGPAELADLARVANEMLARREADELRLRDLNERLEDALVQLVDAREDERRSIALALHDGPVQALTASLWQLADLETDARLVEPAKNVRANLGATLASLRDLTFELRPRALDEGGLPVALGELADRARQEGDMKVELEVNDRLRHDRLPAHLETLLYRTAQESLRNVRQHARASCVRLVMARADNEVVLSVVDNGVGVEAAELTRKAGAGHYGVSSMRETVALAGGSFEIAPGPGRGTAVTVRIPFPSSTGAA